MMTTNVNHKCDLHPDPFDCADHLIYYSAKSDAYGIMIHDGGSSYISIQHCPWCGTKLPATPNE